VTDASESVPEGEPVQTRLPEEEGSSPTAPTEDSPPEAQASDDREEHAPAEESPPESQASDDQEEHAPAEDSSPEAQVSDDQKEHASATFEPEVEPLPEEDEQEPQDFYGWLMRSYSRMREGSEDEAWEAAQKALELGTDEPNLYVHLCQQFKPERRRQLAHAAMQVTPPSHDAFQWLWVEVALSYWYQGNYPEAVAEFETVLKQQGLDPRLVGVLENSLGMSLEAAGRYKEAEERYMATGNPEAAVRARARSGDVAGALKLLEQGIGPSEPAIHQALEATFQGLLGLPIPDLSARLEALEAFQDDWVYNDFMAGVLLVVGKRLEEGAFRLERFLEACRVHSNEWGTTLRWEAGIAEEVLRILAGDTESPDAQEDAEVQESPAPEEMGDSGASE
jgi:tetratricopeptide (TPR) repeat protein